MIKSVILNSNEMLVFASEHANVLKSLKQLKGIVRREYYHGDNIKTIVRAKIILDAILSEKYTVSEEEPNTIYLNI